MPYSLLNLDFTFGPINLVWLLQVIMDSLFTKLSTIENYEEVLAEIVNTAARRFEMKCYMTPKEKHMLLKVCLSDRSMESRK